jgi:PHP family Zn ribbon phosphoesterase
MHRIDDLGDRAYGFIPEKSIPFISTIPLEEIIAETLGVGVTSKKVIEKYEQIVSQVSEFSVLLDMPKQEIILLAGPEIAESVFRVRENKVTINPGYDGVFGKINIYSDEERIKLFSKRVQSMLFT